MIFKLHQYLQLLSLVWFVSDCSLHFLSLFLLVHHLSDFSHVSFHLFLGFSICFNIFSLSIIFLVTGAKKKSAWERAQRTRTASAGCAQDARGTPKRLVKVISSVFMAAMGLGWSVPGAQGTLSRPLFFTGGSFFGAGFTGCRITPKMGLLQRASFLSSLGCETSRESESVCQLKGASKDEQAREVRGVASKPSTATPWVVGKTCAERGRTRSI